MTLDDSEYDEIQRAARKRGISGSEWVRQVLDAALHQEIGSDVYRKLAAVRKGMECSFPTGDIASILSDIDEGRGPIA